VLSLERVKQSESHNIYTALYSWYFSQTWYELIFHCWLFVEPADNDLWYSPWNYLCFRFHSVSSS